MYFPSDENKVLKSDDFESNSHILTASRLKMGKLQNYLKSRIVADTISKEYSSRLQYRVVNVAEL